METENVKITGDVKGQFASDKDVYDFLLALQQLMEVYQIDKVDICWGRFTANNNLIGDTNG